jgi:hypothetical protein
MRAPLGLAALVRLRIAMGRGFEEVEVDWRAGKRAWGLL